MRRKFPVLSEDVRDEPEGGADDERNIRQAAIALSPSVVVLEGQGDDAQEQEGNTPGECDPAERQISKKKIRKSSG